MPLSLEQIRAKSSERISTYIAALIRAIENSQLLAVIGGEREKQHCYRIKLANSAILNNLSIGQFDGPAKEAVSNAVQAYFIKPELGWRSVILCFEDNSDVSVYFYYL